MPGTFPLFRSRLFSVLSSTASLVVIHGGRFSGKTTLVRTWLMTDPASDAVVVFVREPAPEVTPGDYWSGVLTSVCTYAGAEPRDPSLEVLDAVRAVFTALDRPVVLVFDGVESVDSVDEGIVSLLAQCPRLRVIVTTRVAGPWLRHLRTGSDRTMLTSDDLAFTVDETTAYLRAAGVPQGPRSARWITRRTDGLAVMVAAVRESVQSAGAQAGEMEGLDDIIDSTIGRVLLRTLKDDPALAPLCRRIQLSAAALSLTASSAAVVLDGTDTAAFLDILEHAGLVESGHGPDEPEWTYPDAVRGSLLCLADAEFPVELQAVRDALVRWWLDRASPHTALTHAIEGRNWPWALKIAEEHWMSLHAGGYLVALGGALLELLPASIADSDPTAVAIRRLHRHSAAPWNVPVVVAEQGTVEQGTALRTPSASVEMIVRAMSMRIAGAFTEAAEVCDIVASDPVPILGELDDTTRETHAFRYLHIGLTYLLVDRTHDAIAMFRRAHCSGTGGVVERDAAGKLALAHVVWGAGADARFWLDEEQQHPPLPGKAEKVVRTAGLVAAALIALDRIDPDAALDALAELGVPADNEELWAFVLYARGQHALLAGMPADGLRYIDFERTRYTHLCDGVPGLLLDAVRADLNMALGRVDRAQDLVGQSTHPLTAPVRARILLLTADPAGAEAIVYRYDTDPRCSPRISMELAVLGAAASCSLGHRSEARRHLTRAVTLSRQTGLLLPFTGLAAPMIRDLASLGVELPVDVDRVVPEFALFRSFPPAVRLTPRERAVLDALIAGGTASTIAKAQFVSLNTVKTQLRSLYRKLGVHSRKDAIAAARRLTSA